MMVKSRLNIFFVVGLMTVLVDFTVYILMLKLSGSALYPKGVGFISGTIFAYFANRFWTFGDVNTETSSFIRFVTLYSITLYVNVIVNKGALLLFTEYDNTKIMAAFFAATFCSASLNYLGMKYFVFAQQKTAP